MNESGCEVEQIEIHQKNVIYTSWPVDSDFAESRKTPPTVCQHLHFIILERLLKLLSSV
jgi:hypothetical protein